MKDNIASILDKERAKMDNGVKPIKNRENTSTTTNSMINSTRTVPVMNSSTTYESVEAIRPTRTNTNINRTVGRTKMGFNTNNTSLTSYSRGEIPASVEGKALTVPEKRALGIDNPAVPVVQLQYVPLSAEAIPHVELEDTEGRFSNMLDNMLIQNNVSTFPVCELPVMLQSVKYTDYSITVNKGIEVITSNTKLLNQNRVEDFVDTCYSQFINNMVTDFSLEHNLTINNTTYVVPKFNNYEVQYIIGRFRNYDPAILMVGDEQNLVLKLYSNSDMFGNLNIRVDDLI